jgi:hypothetical protein
MEVLYRDLPADTEEKTEALSQPVCEPSNFQIKVIKPVLHQPKECGSVDSRFTITPRF